MIIILMLMMIVMVILELRYSNGWKDNDDNEENNYEIMAPKINVLIFKCMFWFGVLFFVVYGIFDSFELILLECFFLSLLGLYGELSFCKKIVVTGDKIRIYVPFRKEKTINLSDIDVKVEMMVKQPGKRGRNLMILFSNGKKLIRIVDWYKNYTLFEETLKSLGKI